MAEDNTIWERFEWHGLEYQIVCARGDYVMDFVVTRLDETNGDSVLCRGGLKFDGCVNMDFGENGVMVHFCGLKDALVLNEVMRRLYGLGGRLVANWCYDGGD